MKGLQPVIWSKGTFLTPQHLQAQDRFIENTLRFQVEALAFRPWGFDTIEVEQSSLAAGVVGIAKAGGIFPDGLLFDIPDSDQAPAPKALPDLFEADQTSIELFLGIPQYREKGLNVASAAVNVDARFRAEVALMRDENTGLAEKPVQLATKNLRILIGKEVREGTSALPFARVIRTREGLFQLDPAFVPPLLNYNANDYLVSIVRRLIEILSAKSSELSGMRREKNKSLASFTASDIPNFWLLYTINSAVPAFFHLFSMKQGHPEKLFNLMISLAGALTTFSTTIQPRDLPKYDHNDLGPCFGDLDSKIRVLLETVVPSNFVALPLTQVQPTIYATAIEQDRYLKNTRMYLAVNAEMKAADLVERAPQLIKVASASHIEMLVRMALNGVPITYVPSPPASIPVKMNYHYFSLSQGGSGAWESIVRARNFAVHVPGEFPNPQLELLILLPQAQ